MKSAASLIRISNHQVETLQKRLAGLTQARMAAEMKLAILQAEADAENAHAARDAEANFYRIGFMQGWRLRRTKALADIEAARTEEAGAREALTAAFEELKKYEHVLEMAKLADRKEADRRETAALDELGLRRSQAR